MKVKELLSDESKWCQGPYAKNAAGEDVMWDDPAACQWCLCGATHLCYGEDAEYHEAINRIAVAAGISSSFAVPEVVLFNDNPTTTFADIQRVRELADV